MKPRVVVQLYLCTFVVFTHLCGSFAQSWPIECDAGYRNSWTHKTPLDYTTNVCWPCYEGDYAVKVITGWDLTQYCNYCAAGKQTSGGEILEVFGSKHYRVATGCEDCAAGYVAWAQRTPLCHLCGYGETSGVGATECSKCPLGTKYTKEDSGTSDVWGDTI